MANRMHRGKDLVWAMPFNVAYNSSNPIGWPKMYFEIIGKDWRYRDIVKGYGCINIPLSAGRYTRKARVFVPVETNQSWSELFNNMFGFKELKEGENVIGFSKGREASKVAVLG